MEDEDFPDLSALLCPVDEDDDAVSIEFTDLESLDDDVLDVLFV